MLPWTSFSIVSEMTCYVLRTLVVVVVMVHWFYLGMWMAADHEQYSQHDCINKIWRQIAFALWCWWCCAQQAGNHNHHSICEMNEHLLCVCLVVDKPNQSVSSSKASLTSGVNGLVTLSSAVTQSSSHTIATTTTTPSLLAAAASSGNLVGPSSTTTTAQVTMTSQSSFPTQAAISQQQYKLQQQQQQQQQQQLELQLKQQQHQQQQLAAAAAADAETKRLFANGAPHIMQVKPHTWLDSDTCIRYQIHRLHNITKIVQANPHTCIR